MTEFQAHLADSAATGHASESEPVARFVEQMGLICEYDNLPRIAGRILGLLIVEEGAFSLRELAEKLQVSRGSVSTNARMLTDVGVVERVSLPGDRQDYYQLAPNPFERMLGRMMVGLKQAVAIFDEAAASFPNDRQTAKERIGQMARFHRAAAETLAELIERSVKQQL